VISGLPLFLYSRLATVDESPASDSKQAEDRGCAFGDDRGNPLHARGEVVVCSRPSGSG